MAEGEVPISKTTVGTSPGEVTAEKASNMRVRDETNKTSIALSNDIFDQSNKPEARPVIAEGSTERVDKTLITPHDLNRTQIPRAVDTETAHIASPIPKVVGDRKNPPAPEVAAAALHAVSPEKGQPGNQAIAAGTRSETTAGADLMRNRTDAAGAVTQGGSIKAAITTDGAPQADAKLSGAPTAQRTSEVEPARSTVEPTGQPKAGLDAQVATSTTPNGGLQRIDGNEVAAGQSTPPLTDTTTHPATFRSSPTAVENRSPNPIDKTTPSTADNVKTGAARNQLEVKAEPPPPTERGNTALTATSPVTDKTRGSLKAPEPSGTIGSGTPESKVKATPEPTANLQPDKVKIEPPPLGSRESGNVSAKGDGAAPFTTKAPQQSGQHQGETSVVVDQSPPKPTKSDGAPNAKPPQPNVPATGDAQPVTTPPPSTRGPKIEPGTPGKPPQSTPNAQGDAGSTAVQNPQGKQTDGPGGKTPSTGNPVDGTRVDGTKQPGRVPPVNSDASSTAPGKAGNKVEIQNPAGKTGAAGGAKTDVPPNKAEVPISKNGNVGGKSEAGKQTGKQLEPNTGKNTSGNSASGNAGSESVDPRQGRERAVKQVDAGSHAPDKTSRTPTASDKGFPPTNKAIEPPGKTQATAGKSPGGAEGHSPSSRLPGATENGSASGSESGGAPRGTEKGIASSSEPGGTRTPRGERREPIDKTIKVDPSAPGDRSVRSPQQQIHGDIDKTRIMSGKTDGRAPGSDATRGDATRWDGTGRGPLGNKLGNDGVDANQQSGKNGIRRALNGAQDAIQQTTFTVRDPGLSGKSKGTPAEGILTTRTSKIGNRVPGAKSSSDAQSGKMEPSIGKRILDAGKLPPPTRPTRTELVPAKTDAKPILPGRTKPSAPLPQAENPHGIVRGDKLTAKPLPPARSVQESAKPTEKQSTEKQSTGRPPFDTSPKDKAANPKPTIEKPAAKAEALGIGSPLPGLRGLLTELTQTIVGKVLRTIGDANDFTKTQPMKAVPEIQAETRFRVQEFKPVNQRLELPSPETQTIRIRQSNFQPLTGRANTADGATKGFEKLLPKSEREVARDVERAQETVPHSIRDVFLKFNISLPKRSFHPLITDSGTYVALDDNSSQKLQSFISSGTHQALKPDVVSENRSNRHSWRKEDRFEDNTEHEDDDAEEMAKSRSTSVQKQFPKASSSEDSSARKMYRVQESDTPTSIAVIQLQDAKLVELILEINHLLLQQVYDEDKREHVSVLPVGAMILLPNKLDIAAFRERSAY
jgi:hypothetical protein